MDRDRGADRVEEVFREVLEDDEPAIREGEAGVDQTRRLGSDAGAAQAILSGTPQAPGVAAEREGQMPPPPESRRVDASTEPPATLDASRTDIDRNAAGGGWAGVSEVLESDYETEQLRIRQAEGEPGLPDPDEGDPEERLRP